MFGIKLKGDIVNTAVSYVLALGITGLILGAITLAVNSFGTGLAAPAAAAVQNVTIGLVTFSGQFGNMGTMAGVGILLLFVFGAIGVVGGFMRRE